MFALLTEYPLFVTAFFGLLGAAGGTSVLAQLGRHLGNKKQDALWASWGGSSTTRMLRHRRTLDETPVTPELRQQLEDWLRWPLPTEEEEAENPEWADGQYDKLVDALKAATRDRDKFPLVFAENVNYGFRRNLWGMQTIGIGLSLTAFGISLALFIATIAGRPWPDPLWGLLVKPDPVATIRLAILLANTVFAGFWIGVVRGSWVRVAGDKYAKALFEAVRLLRTQ